MNIEKIMFPVKLESNRLILRPIMVGDENDLMEIYSDSETAKYDDWEPWNSIDEATKMINNSIKYYNSKDILRLGIIRKETGKLVGCCALCDFDNWNEKCMVFFQVNRSEWNNGFATEAVEMIVKFGFETIRLNRIEAFVTPGNIASESVLKKNGFLNEGMMRQMEFYKGEFWDGIIMGIIKDDYEKMTMN